MIDVGSGAGFPQLSPSPAGHGRLLDSLRKRCVLRGGGALASAARVVHGRAEAEAHGVLRASFDIAPPALWRLCGC